jgi:hypothetical protein
MKNDNPIQRSRPLIKETLKHWTLEKKKNIFFTHKNITSFAYKDIIVAISISLLSIGLVILLFWLIRTYPFL